MMNDIKVRIFSRILSLKRMYFPSETILQIRCNETHIKSYDMVMVSDFTDTLHAGLI